MMQSMRLNADPSPGLTLFASAPRKCLEAIAVALALWAAPGQVQADAWIFQPLFRVEQSYEDNVGLRDSDTKESSAATRLTGSANIQHSTDVSSTRANFTVNLKEYWNDTFRSDNNFNFTLNSALRGERNQFGMRGSIIRDNSISTRRVITDPVGPGLDPDDDPDQGLVQSKVKRWRFNIRPSWGYNINERTSTRLRLSYSRIDYEQNDRGLRDYDVVTLVGSVQRALSERTRVLVEANVGRFETDDGDNETKNVRINGDLQYRFTETFQGQFRVGWRWTDVDNPGNSGSDDGRVLGVSLTKTTETASLRGEATQELVPTGTGTVRKQERIKLQYRQALDPRWSFALRGEYFRQKALDGDDGDRVNRDFVSIEPRLSWNITEWWTLGASYRYRWVDRESADDTADSNSVFVNLSYTKPVPLF